MLFEASVLDHGFSIVFVRWKANVCMVRHLELRKSEPIGLDDLHSDPRATSVVLKVTGGSTFQRVLFMVETAEAYPIQASH